MDLTPTEEQNFHDELKWCVGQLEMGLERQNPDSRQAAESVKILKILRSSKASFIKKRQVMHNAFGDYRKKMRNSEKKLLSGLKHSKFRPSVNLKSHSRSKFLRQSYSRTSEQESIGRHLDGLSLNQQTGDDAAHSNIHVVDSGRLLTGIDSSNSELPGTSCSGSTDIKNMFQFRPSDNSFSFGFNVDNSELDMRHPEHCSTQEGQEGTAGGECFEGKPHTSPFKYNTSDNSFCFNFSSDKA